MALFVENPDAMKIQTKFQWDINAERKFDFGESLGDFESNGIISHDQFNSLLDGDPVVRKYNNFIVNPGHIITSTLRCKGLYLVIEGDLILNGIISMTARGAKAAGRYVGIDYINDLIYFDPTNNFTPVGMPVVNKVGGPGAARVSAWTPADSIKNNQHQYVPGLVGGEVEDGAGGGGSGAAYSSHGGTIYSGTGAAGNSFSGGPGGGSAICIESGGNGYNATIDGGAGGAARIINPAVAEVLRAAGGGAGNPGGAKVSIYGGIASAGGNGTGGLIILIVKGNILFGPTGKIVSKGTDGGRGDNVGGGASGGGIIKIFTKQDLVDLTKFDVSGGLGGAGNAKGGNGGFGSLKIHKVRYLH